MHIENQRVDTHLLEDKSGSRRASVRAIDLHYISQIHRRVFVFFWNNVECVRNGATNDPILDRGWGGRVRSTFSEGCETQLTFIVLREHPGSLNVIERLRQSSIGLCASNHVNPKMIECRGDVMT